MGKPVVKKTKHHGINKLLELESQPYGTLLRYGMAGLLQQEEVAEHLGKDHTFNTPERFVKALEELIEGCFKDPKEILKRSFEEGTYNDLIIVKDIDFVSLCAHHFLPFIGKVHFGYLPHKKIVGLSKIPRLIEVLTHRPQIQERLSSQIVEIFQEVVSPKGCGVVVSANHLCMSIRGVRKAGAITETTALQGDFLTNQSLKQEFLASVRRS